MAAAVLLATLAALLLWFATRPAANPAPPVADRVSHPAPEPASTSLPPGPVPRHTIQGRARVRAGDQWRIEGSICELAPWRERRERVPLTNATIHAEVRRGGEIERLTAARSRQDGSYSLPLDTWPSHNSESNDAQGRNAELWLRAVQPGYRPRAVRIRATALLEATASRTLKQDLWLEHGATVQGRVVDAAGSPVPDANVALHATEDPARIAIYASPRTDALGRFSLPITDPGDYHLIAHAATAGVADLALGAIADRDVAVGDVELRTLGTLQGRVTLSDGTALAQARVVYARAEDPSIGSDHRFLEMSDAGVRPTRNAAVSTDAEGKFRMAGLAPGRYALGLADDLGVTHEELFDTTPAAAELRLPCQLLSVAVRHQDGSFAARGKLHWRGSGPEAEGLPTGSGAAVLRRGPSRTVPLQGAAIDLLLPHDTTVVLAARDTGGRSTEEVWRVEPGRARAQLTLQVQPPEPDGALRLVVIGPDGAAVDDYRVTVETPEGHLRHQAWPATTEPIDLPPGRHRLIVRPTPKPGRDLWCAADLVIDIVSGHTTDAIASIQRGGSLQLEAIGGFARIHLERPHVGGSGARTYAATTQRTTAAHGTAVGHALTEAMPPGPCEVVFVLGNGRTHRVSARVEQGRTSLVRVDLRNPATRAGK
ncbi:MAG: carboxypeptidase regulatory-like domain-containing protein [Planctomycetota bacterium]